MEFSLLKWRMRLLVTLLGIFSFHLRCIQSQGCQCDMTANKCDVNCCCDGDCNDNDKLSFSVCITENQNRIEQVCRSDVLLYAANGRYEAQGNGAGLFCIYRDNYEARHSFSTVPTVSTQEAFDELASQSRRSSSPTMSQQMPSTQYQNTFKVGDPMFVLFENNQQGYLSQPVKFINGECRDNNPAGFLFTNESSCYRIVNNLTKQCQSTNTWNSKTYLRGFSIAPYPSFVSKEIFTSTSANSTKTTVRNELLIVPTLRLPLQCVDAEGVTKDCGVTDLIPLLRKGQCVNVAMQVRYHITYKTNITVQISKVEVSFVLGTLLPSTKNNFQQVFSYEFLHDKTIPDANVTQRSGNPGYIVGLPVLSRNNTEIETFSVMKATTNGVCSNDTEAQQLVNFGVDYQTGCFISLASNPTVSECEQLQDDIYDYLLATVPSEIASFGNSDENTPDEWISVINKKPSSSVTEANGQCYSVITDVLFNVLYAKTGYFANPQEKIVGFQVMYGEPRDLYVCSGLLCQGNNQVVVTQSVTFVDVSSTPQAEVKPKPEFRSKAPNDFFFPFL